MKRFWDGRTDGRTDEWSDCTPRPAFAFGEAGKNKGPLKVSYIFIYTHMYIYYTSNDFSLYKSQSIL